MWNLAVGWRESSQRQPVSQSSVVRQRWLITMVASRISRWLKRIPGSTGDLSPGHNRLYDHPVSYFSTCQRLLVGRVAFKTLAQGESSAKVVRKRFFNRSEGNSRLLSPSTARRHHSTTRRSFQSRPPGLPGSNRASQTGVSAPSSGLRFAFAPPMSVRTQPGIAALAISSCELYSPCR